MAAVYNEDSTHPRASLLLGTGDGRFVRAPRSITLPSQSDALVAGDFNGDGFPDLATANSDNGNQHSVSVLLNRGDGSGTFNPATAPAHDHTQ